MKRIFISPILFIGIFSMSFLGCEKEKEDEVVQNPPAVLPVILTNTIEHITPNTAISGGNITSDGGATITSRGVCWSIYHNPTISDSLTVNGTGPGLFSSNISGLSSTMTYYVRAYATNSAGTVYGNEMCFKTYSATVTDIEGNIYNTVVIGNMEWMAENLRTTRFTNNTLIPMVTDNYAWYTLNTPGYCFYNNDTLLGNTYGALYNSYAVDNSLLCPDGWHVPTSAEWSVFVLSLGLQYSVGGMLKEQGTAHWQSPNTGATNETGFTALPGGYRYRNGPFNDIALYGFWWTINVEIYSDTVITTPEAKFLYFGTNTNYDYQRETKNSGFSVRCLKD